MKASDLGAPSRRARVSDLGARSRRAKGQRPWSAKPPRDGQRPWSAKPPVRISGLGAPSRRAQRPKRATRGSATLESEAAARGTAALESPSRRVRVSDLGARSRRAKDSGPGAPSRRARVSGLGATSGLVGRRPKDRRPMNSAAKPGDPAGRATSGVREPSSDRGSQPRQQSGQPFRPDRPQSPRETPARPKPDGAAPPKKRDHESPGQRPAPEQIATKPEPPERG